MELLKKFFETLCVLEEVCYKVSFTMWYEADCTDFTCLINSNTVLLTPGLRGAICKIFNCVSRDCGALLCFFASNTVKYLKIFEWFNPVGARAGGSGGKRRRHSALPSRSTTARLAPFADL